MKKTYQCPLIVDITTITNDHVLAGESITVIVNPDEEYSGTAASNESSHFSIWKDDDEEDGF